MIGLKEQSDDLRTYALDRVREMTISAESFVMPEDADPTEFFKNIIGVTTSKADVRCVKLQANSTQAKYFRALPFHESQQEEIHESYSIFTYKLKLNYELVHEILSYGSSVKVLAPKELKIMVAEEIKQMSECYINDMTNTENRNKNGQ
jgi:predicted DNA-binding transcriptional regulator YafY